MSNVVVVSSAHTADERAYECFRMSCRDLEIPLHILGTDLSLSYYSNDPRLFNESVGRTLQFLQQRTEEYVVSSDAFDVIASRWSEAELITAIEKSEIGLLISCEANCFPDGPWKAVYDADALWTGASYWRYANAGQMCGRRESMIALLEVIRDYMPKATCGGQANEVLHLLYMEHYGFRLDWRCEIFQSMYTNAQTLVAPHRDSEGKVSAYNTKFSTYPMFLHFNGRAPEMPRWYRHLTDRTYPRNSMRPEYA